MQSFSDLAAIFEKQFSELMPFTQAPATLYEPCGYFLRLGGKRVRPVICLMGSELFGDIGSDAWHAAYAVELFHNFTLIHDDIMDKAPLRRGQPTLHTKYGLTSGILCGDVVNIYAYTQLASISGHLQQILQLFNATAIAVCEGQQLDMDFEQRNDVRIEEYIQMITLKTSVLLACSLKMGALTNGAMGDNANKLYEFGKNLGIAFQLQDDYLDAFGEPDKLGKQSGGDIIANKKTYLLLKALENANSAQRERILSLLQQDGSHKVPAMLDLFATTGADAACREAVASYSENAFTSLAAVAIQEKRKAPLLALARYLLMRDK